MAGSLRTALQNAVARRRIRREVRRLAADECDREAMRIIREQLAALAPAVRLLRPRRNAT
jgi:hypothetical protein